MDCQAARAQVDLDFGGGSRPEELRAHLESCAACQAYAEELDQLGSGLGADIDFELSAADLEHACKAVDARIDRLERPGFGGISWIRPFLRVAAVLLVVGASFAVGRFSSYPEQSIARVGELTSTSELALIFADEYAAEELDDGIIRTLIDDYSAARSFEAGESLLGDISQSEMEYLMQNFEIGDLL